MRRREIASKPDMKSCLGMLLILSAFVLVVGGGAAIWYLSDSVEFSRKDAKAPPPKAISAPKTH
jgi:flagellar basal body-associated protein FliL